MRIEPMVRASLPRGYTGLGRRADAQCTALGKVLLAALPFAEVHQLIEMHGWRPSTERSLRSYVALQEALCEVRE